MLQRVALLVTTLAILHPAAAQIFQNLFFDRHCDSCATGLTDWSVSWAGKSTTIGVAQQGERTSMRITNTADNGVGFVEQAASTGNSHEEQLITLSARIATDSVIGRGAGLNIAVYDGEGGLLYNQDMGYAGFNWPSGTRPPEPRTIKAIVPADAASVRIGMILYGRGTADFSDLAVDIQPLAGREAGPQGTAYVDAACDTIRRRSLRRDSVDLAALRTTALKIAGSGNDADDHHLAVRYLLAGLGDHHSFLMTPAEVKAWEGEGSAPAPFEFAKHRVIEGCGYLSIPGFASRDSASMAAFADTIQQTLRRLDRLDLKGWIIDLRQNSGGNMTPMICGLGPLFDPGPLGQLIDVDGRREIWSYAAGIYAWNDEPSMHAPHPITLSSKLPIAVLWSQPTGSSGECVAISFIGNSRTRSFGQPTWGLTTGNGEFELPDGARMFLASTVMADRNGRAFHGPIAPDQIVEQPSDRAVDASLQAALDWIATQHRSGEKHR